VRRDAPANRHLLRVVNAFIDMGGLQAMLDVLNGERGGDAHWWRAGLTFRGSSEDHAGAGAPCSAAACGAENTARARLLGRREPRHRCVGDPDWRRRAQYALKVRDALLGFVGRLEGDALKA
jgi:hypothetical protein